MASVEQYRHLLSLALINASDERQGESISSELNLLAKTMERTGS